MGFERCHPAVNLIYFAAVIAGTAAFRHPVCLAISLFSAFLYSVKRNGPRAIVFDLCLLPLSALFALFYSSYHHFGVTILGYNFIGNRLTLESLVCGLVLGLVIAGVLIWFSCVFSVFSADKVVYLFGRLSPRLSLFLAILLRMVPRLKQEARRINTARQGVGRGANQGGALRRLGNGLGIFSMLISWTIESLASLSESMRSRGSALRGRTAFSIYRFDNRDRAFVIALFACLTLTLMAALLGQTDMLYNPRLSMGPITPMSALCYGGYCALCLMPLALEVWTQFRFRNALRGLQAARPDKE